MRAGTVPGPMWLMGTINTELFRKFFPWFKWFSSIHALIIIPMSTQFQWSLFQWVLKGWGNTLTFIRVLSLCSPVSSGSLSCNHQLLWSLWIFSPIYSTQWVSWILPGFSVHVLWSGNFHKVEIWDNCGAHLMRFLFLRDHCPLLPAYWESLFHIFNLAILVVP